MNKIQNRLCEIATGTYALLFGRIFIAILFFNNMFSYRITVQAVILLFFAAFAAVFMHIYRKYNKVFIDHSNAILLVCCNLMLLAFTVIRLQMKTTVTYDYDKTLTGAMTYAVSGAGDEFEPYRTYMYRYPFQSGIFLIQQLLFKIALKLGFSDQFYVALLIGEIMYILAVVCVFRYLEENYSMDAAFFSLLISMMCIQMYFQANIAYTDTYSVLGPPSILLFTTRALAAKSNKSRIINSLISGICRGIFINIKSTVRIVLIALIIQAIIQKRDKNSLKVFAVILILVFSVGRYFDYQADKIIFTDEVRKQESLPLTHWLMMGLQGDGSYNSDDEWGITVPTQYSDRVSKNIEVIKERLKDMGILGYLKLLYTKTCRSFGSGNLDIQYSYRYSDESEPVNELYDIVLLNGNKYYLLNNISQGIYLFIILLSVAGAAISVKRKRITAIAPYVSITGFWMFMMLWESNHRQLVNQWMIFISAAAVGMYRIYTEVCTEPDLIE